MQKITVQSFPHRYKTVVKVWYSLKEHTMKGREKAPITRRALNRKTNCRRGNRSQHKREIRTG